MLRTVRVLTVLLLPVSHAAAFDVLVGEILREAPDRIVQTEWGGVAVDSQRWGVVSTAGGDSVYMHYSARIRARLTAKPTHTKLILPFKMAFSSVDPPMVLGVTAQAGGDYFVLRADSDGMVEQNVEWRSHMMPLHLHLPANKRLTQLDTLMLRFDASCIRSM